MDGPADVVLQTEWAIWEPVLKYVVMGRLYVGARFSDVLRADGSDNSHGPIKVQCRKRVHNARRLDQEVEGASLRVIRDILRLPRYADRASIGARASRH